MKASDTQSDRCPTTRRSVLKTAGIGVAGFTSVGSVRAHNMVEVVITRNADGPVETKKVPRAAHEHDQHVKEVLAAYRERTRDNPAIASTSVVLSDEEIAGQPATQIKVYVSERNELHSVPSEIDGVETSTAVEPPFGKACYDGDGCYNVSVSDPVPGGAQGESPSGLGTMGLKVDEGGDKWMMTANHIFGTCENNSEETLCQNGTPCGTHQGSSQSQDWALVDSSGEISGYKPGILDPVDGGVHAVNAWFTETGLTDAMKTGRPMYKVGTKTGKESGTVKEVNTSQSKDCIEMNGHGVHYTVDSAEGDSGGPMFAEGKENPGAYVLASIMNFWINYYWDGTSECGTSKHPGTVGLGFYKINNDHGIIPADS